MMACDLVPLVEQYRAGLEAELALLHRLETLAERQREASQQGDLHALAIVTDERDGLMASIVTIEHEMKPIRVKLLERRGDLQGSVEYRELAALHRNAAALVSTIVASDHESLAALQEAELARRFAARVLEQGENTLAAYRRVVAPPLAGATLVDKKG
ncbi:MAG: hypothetical protein HY657_13045 [Acidobacteria bacterium]|nr:hypothetical protein [Acidobacteriota bacterium]